MRICEEHRLGGVARVEDHECVGCVVDALVKERDTYGRALEEIRDMMSPANRERLVMQGPRAMIGVYNVVEAALASPKT